MIQPLPTDVSCRARPRILIVDDDVALGAMLLRLLESEGFEIDYEANSIAAVERCAQSSFDLIILDVTMPALDGFALLRRIREAGDTPVMMLTARGDEDDRVLGLNEGADDYLGKPFGARELVARVKALLRRSPRPPIAGPDIRSVGPLSIDHLSMSASLNGKRLALTLAEFRVLDVLASAPGEVQSRDHLCRFALGRALEPFDRSIDTHVSNIRRKLKLGSPGPLAIQGARGRGYVLTLEGQSA